MPALHLRSDPQPGMKLCRARLSASCCRNRAESDSGMMGGVSRRVTLAEWARKVKRSKSYVQNYWRPEDDFPQAAGQRATGRGRPSDEFVEEELDNWLKRHQEMGSRPGQAPLPFPMPDDPEAFHTLGAIARMLGVNDKTVNQYRSALDERVEFIEYKTRRKYQVRGVVGFLNDRKGRGVAADPAADRRPANSGRRASQRSQEAMEASPSAET